MHPIILPVAELKCALAGFGKIINPRSATLAALNHLKVERTREGWITLTATDLNHFVTLRLEHPADGPAVAVLVPYEQLQQVARNCGRNETLTLDITPQGTVIQFALADKTGEAKVQSVPVEEFPPTPRLKTDPVPLPPECRRSLLEALDCASTDPTRLVLNGAFIDAASPKAQYVVGTDGKHLYSANSFTLPLKRSLIIPKHKFLEWREFNADGDWQLRADDPWVQLSTRRWRFISKQLEGNYPDWRAPIPDPRRARTVIQLDPAKLDELSKLIQRMPCHDERFSSIGLEWREGQFQLLAKEHPADPWLRVPCAGSKGQGPELTTFIDRRLLAKALQFGLPTLSLIDPLAPIRFAGGGKTLIVMPVRPDATPGPSPVNRNPAPAATRFVAAAAPPTPNKPMIATPTPPSPAPGEAKNALEEALDLTLQIRDRLNDGFNLLRELSLKLKLAQREQKLNAREVHSVRSTLRSLQGLKL